MVMNLCLWPSISGCWRSDEILKIPHRKLITQGEIRSWWTSKSCTQRLSFDTCQNDWQTTPLSKSMSRESFIQTTSRSCRVKCLARESSTWQLHIKAKKSCKFSPTQDRKFLTETSTFNLTARCSSFTQLPLLAMIITSEDFFRLNN